MYDVWTQLYPLSGIFATEGFNRVFADLIDMCPIVGRRNAKKNICAVS